MNATVLIELGPTHAHYVLPIVLLFAAINTYATTKSRSQATVN